MNDTLGECVREVRDEFGEYNLNLHDGYTDVEEGQNDPGRTALRIAPSCVLAYLDMTWDGMKQCVTDRVLVEGQSQYRAPAVFGLVEAAYLVDPDNNRKLPLNITTRAQLDFGRDILNQDHNSRPTAIWFGGGYYGFDVAPDKTYTLSILADTLPTMELEPDAEPTYMDQVLRLGWPFLASLHIGRRLLRRKDNTEFTLAHYNELAREAMKWADRVGSLYANRARFLAQSPLVNDYRRDYGD